MATYSWSYAPTNRAGCKGKCKEKIPKGAVRLGVSSDGPGDYSMVVYRCLNCVTDKQVANITTAVGGLDSVDGFTLLTAEDQAQVLSKAGCGAGPAAKAKAGPKAKAKAKTEVAAKSAAKRKAPPSLAEQHSFLDQAKNRDFEAVRVLIEATPELVNVQPGGRWSALHQFAKGGNAAAVRYLLAHGADCNVKTNNGETPHDVATGGCVALLKKTNEDEDSAAEEEMEEEEEEEEEEEVPPVPAPPKALGSKRKEADAASSGAAGSTTKKAKLGRPVDSAVPSRDNYTVVDDWSVLLNQTNLDANNNKYYKMQILQNTANDYFCWQHWGRVGASGQSKLDLCGDQASAEASFKKKFREKSGVAYELKSTHDWTPTVGKYTLVETDEQEGAESGQGAPLGKLTPQQIEKGQGVLQRLDAALSKKKMSELQDLSSQYYTFIPHDFGMKVPPAINTREMLEAEEELLKFYLRMGFEEMDKVDDGLSPINGIMNLKLPKSLEEACTKLCSTGEIKASSDKGKMHAGKQSGSPTQAMEQHLYGSIMLYTSNAIYKKLNDVLRSEDRTKIKIYKPYLRLLLEALGRLPQQSKTLWRGIGVDLFDQYPKGSTVTWWGVSSCTADQQVARNFMKGCGGKCTLLTVKTKTAADISTITFFGNEKENLLAPGTQLKVLSSKREGKITEITMEEVGRVLD